MFDKKLYYIMVDEGRKFKEIFPENNTIEMQPNSFVFITQDDMKEYLEANDLTNETQYDKNIYENI